MIHAVLPLAEARRAHELMAANANTGKLVLQVDPSLRYGGLDPRRGATCSAGACGAYPAAGQPAARPL